MQGQALLPIPRCVLTEPRLTLLQTIRTRRPQSIAALAKLVKRDFKNVREDVTILSDLGLIELQAGLRPRGAMPLTVPDRYIQFEIAV